MIDLHIEGPIATVTLCRPPVNAINDEWVSRFDEVLDTIAAADAVAVVWLRSTQKVFCAGADLAMMRNILASAEGRARMIAMTRRMQEVFERIETLPKTTLAEIAGPALGGGFELALSCDLRIVADGARVGLPEAALGLLPAGGGTQRMTRICGEATARRLILGAETIGGEEAVRLGLAQWCVPGAQLEEFARATAARIAGLPPRALAECKACIDVSAKGGADGYEIELAGSGALLAMPETLARVARFLEGAARRVSSGSAAIPDQIETPRLRLARPCVEDWAGLHAYYSDAESARYTFTNPLPESETQRVVGALLKHWQRHGYGPYVLHDRRSADVVGLVGLWFPREWPETEIKWAVIRAHWGKGYASEAQRAVQAMLPAHLPQMQPISLIHAENERSIALALALGATLEKQLEFRNAPFHQYRHRKHGG